MQQQHHNPARSLPNVFAFSVSEPLSDKVFANLFADVFALAFAGSGHAATLSTLSSGARAAALLLRTFAVGLRALGLYTPAQLLHNSPFGRSLSSLRALAKSLPVSGLLLQPFWSAASARLESSRRFEAARSAPDWRPIPSLRSVIPQAASRARFALDQAPHPSRLGTLPPLSLVGTRSCLYRDRISQRSGASFTLRRLGAAYHGSPAPWGPAQTSLKPRSSCCIRSGLLGQPSVCFTARAACARPKTRRVLRQTTDRRISSWVTNIFQSAIKFHQGVNQSSCLSLN
jgi:hypothetical protein